MSCSYSCEDWMSESSNIGGPPIYHNVWRPLVSGNLPAPVSPAWLIALSKRGYAWASAARTAASRSIEPKTFD
jgi:hypothetical protein